MMAVLLQQHKAAPCTVKSLKWLYKPWTLILAIKEDDAHLAFLLISVWSRVGGVLCQRVRSMLHNERCFNIKGVCVPKVSLQLYQLVLVPLYPDALCKNFTRSFRGALQWEVWSQCQ